jgi:hypothetical protein
MPAIRGIEATLNMKKTASFAEASGATTWQKLNYYSERFDPGQSVISDPEIGGNRHNPTDPLQGVKARPNPSGALQVAADLNQLGFLLSLLMGNPVTDDAADPVFEHVWTSGKTAPNLAHFEVGYASGLYKIADAFTVSQITLGFADEDGTRKVDCTMMGRSVRFPVAALASSPTATPARDKLSGTKGLLKIGGVALGNVLGGSFTLGNGAFTETYMDDSEWAGAVEIGEWMCSLSPEIRFRSEQAALLSSFDGSTPFAVELLYQLSADRLLKIELPNVIANPVAPSAGNLGMMSVTPTFMASQTDAAPMATVTIRNAVAAY